VDWLELVNTTQTHAEEAAMKQCIREARPYGDPPWQHKTARRLGLTACFREGGHP
jgi:hypothetical protein